MSLTDEQKKKLQSIQRPRQMKGVNYPCGWFDPEQLPGGSREKTK